MHGRSRSWLQNLARRFCARSARLNEPREDRTAYLPDWLALLGDEPKVIFTAANKAREAIGYLGATATGQLDGVPEPV